jgi:hypothetical protein
MAEHGRVITQFQSLFTARGQAASRGIIAHDVGSPELLDIFSNVKNLGLPDEVHYLPGNFTDESGEAKHNPASVTSPANESLGVRLLECPAAIGPWSLAR